MNRIKIGVTERGDAALDFSWVTSVLDGHVDGAIVISKNLSPRLASALIELNAKGKNIILHAGCTGWGKTPMEPNVPGFGVQLESLKQLITQGFPASRCVLRIDPIIPTSEGIARADAVLTKLERLAIPPVRIRVSVMDGYAHALKRMTERGYDVSSLTYKPSAQQLDAVAQMLCSHPGRLYETCAEDGLALRAPGRFICCGCVSNIDLALFGLRYENGFSNPQNRFGCQCLGCKTELLKHRHPCAHQCAYCYWKD